MRQPRSRSFCARSDGVTVERSSWGLLLPIFGLHAANSPVGSLAFWGHFLVLLGILFVLGMMRFVASPRSDLKGRPADDLAFWHAEILRLARLLRFVPLWYIAPILPGLALVLWPTVVDLWQRSNLIDNAIQAVALLVVVTVLGAVWWLNARASAQMERKARRIKEWEANMLDQPVS